MSKNKTTAKDETPKLQEPHKLGTVIDKPKNYKVDWKDVRTLSKLTDILELLGITIYIPNPTKEQKELIEQGYLREIGDEQNASSR